MNARQNHPAAGRYDSSDEPREFTLDQQRRIDEAVTEMLDARLCLGEPEFADLLNGIPTEAIAPHLQRAMRYIDIACLGNEVAIAAVLSAMSDLQKALKAEAESAWTEELRDRAEEQYMEAA